MVSKPLDALWCPRGRVKVSGETWIRHQTYLIGNGDGRRGWGGVKEEGGGCLASKEVEALMEGSCGSQWVWTTLSSLLFRTLLKKDGIRNGTQGEVARSCKDGKPICLALAIPQHPGNALPVLPLPLELAEAVTLTGSSLVLKG